MGKPVDIMLSFRNAGLTALSDVRVAVSLQPGSSPGEILFDETVAPGASSHARRFTIPCIPGGRTVVEAYITGEADPVSAADDTVRVTLDIPVAPGTVILNEIMAAPGHGPEWVEVYNTSEWPVSLLGWKLRDGAGKDSGPLGAVAVNGGGYGVIGAGEPDGTIPGDVPFIRAVRFPVLNNDGDTVVLAGYDGAVQDSVGYTETTTGVSRERISADRKNGSGAWDLCVDPAGSTPGRANSILFDGGGGTSKGVKLKVEPNPFDERTVVSFELPFALARVRLDVYDRKGRKVATLRDGIDSGSRWETSWDGRSGGKRLPAGAYILYLEALDRNTGGIATVRTPLVIARKL